MHLRRFGGIYLLLVFLVLTTTAYWHQSYAYTRHQNTQTCKEIKAQSAEAQCPTWQTQDQRTHFWNGLWENDRSEYEQLFVQSLILIIFANWILTKESENRKKDIREVLREES